MERRGEERRDTKLSFCTRQAERRVSIGAQRTDTGGVSSTQGRRQRRTGRFLLVIAGLCAYTHSTTRSITRQIKEV